MYENMFICIFSPCTLQCDNLPDIIVVDEMEVGTVEMNWSLAKPISSPACAAPVASLAELPVLVPVLL